MIVNIQRDQAVWERETFQVEIPDDTPQQDLDAAVSAALEAFTGWNGPGYSMRNLDEAVMGIDLMIEYTTPDGLTRSLS